MAEAVYSLNLGQIPRLRDSLRSNPSDRAHCSCRALKVLADMADNRGFSFAETAKRVSLVLLSGRVIFEHQLSHLN